MSQPQPGILPPVPALSRYLSFEIAPEADLGAVADRLSRLEIDESTVIGVGAPVIRVLGAEIPGLRPAPPVTGAGVEMPSTQQAIWAWLRGEDRGELLHAGRAIESVLRPAFRRAETIDGFRYRSGLDLTGYDDGTENPTGGRAIDVGFVSGRGQGLDDSSFVAVQKWVHDLDRFEGMPVERQDHTIGRRRSDNEEIEDAPPTAHVKRTAQESFDPEAFILRRSMPWSDGSGSGLVFVAFGATFDPFEALVRRMAGLDDGVADALFDFTHPVTGGYYWCPPIEGRHLDLRALRPRP